MIKGVCDFLTYNSHIFVNTKELAIHFRHKNFLKNVLFYELNILSYYNGACKNIQINFFLINSKLPLLNE